MSRDTYSQCITACNTCAAACHQCVIGCLHEKDVGALAACIALDMDCAALCEAASAAMARDSSFATVLCRLCAEVCLACASECERHDMRHCQDCAAACTRCAEVCEAMA